MNARPDTIDPGQYRPCHTCGQLVRVRATRCRFCGHTLCSDFPLPHIVALVSQTLQNADRLEHAGRFPHDVAAYHGRKLRPRTARILSTAAVLALVCTGATLSPPWLFAQADWIVVEIIAGISAVGLVLLGTLYLVQDLLTPADASRTDPAKALKAFIRALWYRRYLYAYACVLPGSLRRDKGFFRALWAWQTLTSDSRQSRLVLRGITIDPIDEDNVVGSILCTRAPHASPNWIGAVVLVGVLLLFSGQWFGAPIVAIGFLLSNRWKHDHQEEVILLKWLHRVGEKWYLVSGDVHSGEDMLPKLYHDCMDRLCRGDLPPEEVLRNAAMVEA